MSINWGYSEVLIFRFWLSCLTHCFNKISTISILKFWFISKLLRHANLKFWFENILSSLLGDQMTFVIIYQLLQLLFEYHLIYTSRLIGIRGKNFQLKEKYYYVFPYNFGLWDVLSNNAKLSCQSPPHNKILTDKNPCITSLKEHFGYFYIQSMTYFFLTL